MKILSERLMTRAIAVGGGLTTLLVLAAAAVTCWGQAPLRPDQISPATPDLTWAPGGTGYQIGSTIPWRTDSTLTPSFSCTPVTGDAAKSIELTNTGAISSTLPTATAPCGDGFGFIIQVAGGTLTLNAAAGTINGGNSVTIGPYQTASVVSKGGHWYAELSVSTPGTGAGVTPVISGVTLTPGTFTTPAAVNTTVSTITATCSAGSCTGASFALSSPGSGPCSGTGSTDNTKFVVSGGNLNVNGTTAISTAGTFAVGIAVTLAGATGSGTCYAKTLVGSSGFSGTCPQSTTFIARTSGENNTQLDALICGLVTDGLIDTDASMASTGTNPFCGSTGLFDRFWVSAMANAADALLDVCGHPSMVANGPPVFTANAGYQGVDADTTKYLATGFNPATSGVHYLLHASSMSVWPLNNVIGTGNHAMGGYDGTNLALIAPGDSSVGDSFCSMQTLAGTQTLFAGLPPTTIGLFFCNRSSTSAAQIYWNAVSKTPISNPNDNALTNITLDLLGCNGCGTPRAGGPWLVGMAHIGGNMTATQENKYYNRGCTYLTAVHGTC